MIRHGLWPHDSLLHTRLLYDTSPGHTTHLYMYDTTAFLSTRSTSTDMTRRGFDHTTHLYKHETTWVLNPHDPLQIWNDMRSSHMAHLYRHHMTGLLTIRATSTDIQTWFDRTSTDMIRQGLCLTLKTWHYVRSGHTTHLYMHDTTGFLSTIPITSGFFHKTHKHDTTWYDRTYDSPLHTWYNMASGHTTNFY